MSRTEETDDVSAALPDREGKDSVDHRPAGSRRWHDREAHEAPRCSRLRLELRAIEFALSVQRQVQLGATALQILEPERRLWLAACATASLTPEDAEELAETILSDLQAGRPIPPFDGIRDEARHWAAFASRAELKWYLTEIWNRLSDEDRRSFLSRVAAPDVNRAAGRRSHRSENLTPPLDDYRGQ